MYVESDSISIGAAARGEREKNEREEEERGKEEREGDRTLKSILWTQLSLDYRKACEWRGRRRSVCESHRKALKQKDRKTERK